MIKRQSRVKSVGRRDDYELEEEGLGTGAAALPPQKGETILTS